MALIHLNVFSEKLNRNTDLNIVIPADTKLSGRSYPVLYLLHGTYGDYTDWIRKSNVERYAQECGMAVVMMIQIFCLFLCPEIVMVSHFLEIVSKA